MLHLIFPQYKCLNLWLDCFSDSCELTECMDEGQSTTCLQKKGKDNHVLMNIQKTFHYTVTLRLQSVSENSPSVQHPPLDATLFCRVVPVHSNTRLRK